MTFKLVRVLGIVAFITTTCISGCGDDGSADVRAVYDAYNDALQRKDGEAFLKTIDPDNVKHYDQYVQLARKGTKEQIARMRASEREYILILRHRVKPDELARLDGAGFVKLCVERGWFFMEDEGEAFSLGPVKMSPPRASAELRVNGERTRDRLEFVLVEGRWLVNDEALDRVHDQRLVKIAANLRVSEDRLLLEMEAEVTGESVDPGIFDLPPGVAAPTPDAATIARDPATGKKPPKKR